jgi:hypothetical protein
MSGNSDKYFREALSNFTHTAASGGAIAHLADLGYTPREICNMLDFPTPYERVQETFWNHLVEQRIIVEEKSDLAKRKENVHFVTDHGSFGRTSLRRVVEIEEGEQQVDFAVFRRVVYQPAVHGPAAAFLMEHCGPQAYISCDFGLQKDWKLEVLTDKQRLYIEGIPWRRKMVWHRLDLRMAEIVAALQEHASYRGTLLLLREKEEVIIANSPENVTIESS